MRILERPVAPPSVHAQRRTPGVKIGDTGEAIATPHSATQGDTTDA